MRSLVLAWRRRWWRRDPAALAAYDGLRPVTVVTGGSEGIGFELARRFASAGNDVMLVARRPEPLEQAAVQSAPRPRPMRRSLPLDVTAPDALAQIEAALASHRAYADVLVNNAGIGLAGPFHDHAAADGHRSWSISTCAR